LRELEVAPRFAPLLQVAYGGLSAQILWSAATLGIPERLAQEGPATADELAPKPGIEASILERILRALVSLGVCEETNESRFRLTQLGEYLRPGHPDSIESRVLLNGDVFFRLWGELIETIRTGEGGSRRAFGMSFEEYLAQQSRIGALFDRTMASEAPTRHRPALEAYDFGRFKTVVDIGGGNGALIVEILSAHRHLSGIVFDLPRTAASAQKTIEARGLIDRCQFIGGDAREEVPGGGDAYIFANFFVGSDDDRAVLSLRNTRKVIADNVRVLLLEWVMPTRDDAPMSFRSLETVSRDMLLLSISGSKSGVRSLTAFRDLLSASGFEVSAVIPTRGSVTVIEAKPV
jgi:O-methyltransferase domain/Dimerisation domain